MINFNNKIDHQIDEHIEQESKSTSYNELILTVCNLIFEKFPKTSQ